MVGSVAVDRAHVRFIMTYKGVFNVWVVDGDYIRDDVDEQFTNFGQHFRFKFIPLREFWIDRGVSDHETGFFIEHMWVEWHAMSRGASYSAALKLGDEAEKRMRGATGKNTCDPRRAHIRLFRTMPDGTRVWVVNGDYVRQTSGDVNFTEGGHGYIYKYIPKGEIWIDDQVVRGNPHEVENVLTHEYTEQHLMRDRGWGYERAHMAASKEELASRKQSTGGEAHGLVESSIREQARA